MKPTHRLKAKNKTTGIWSDVGAGWINDNGSISIRLNPCVILDDDVNIILTLFPIDEDYHANGKKTKRRLPAESDELPY